MQVFDHDHQKSAGTGDDSATEEGRDAPKKSI
jgi:hypothetical protein